MDGKTLAAGAVAALKHVKNPISLARLVMEKSGHVMMDGEGAEAFAKENGIELVDAKYFFTQERWDALQKMKAAEKHRRRCRQNICYHRSRSTRNGGRCGAGQKWQSRRGDFNRWHNKQAPGRVGDSPIIGAGTYANDATCAVSATGDGEYFIRATVGHDVSALMEYRGMTLQEAAQTAWLDKVAKLGGTGGLIAIDAGQSLCHLIPRECIAGMSIQTASLSWRFIGRDCHVERSRDISRCNN